METMTAKHLARLIAAGTAPEGAVSGVVDLGKNGAKAILPENLRCHTLRARGTGVKQLPGGLRVTHCLDLTGSPNLESLPRGLTCSVLILRDCPRLTALPEDLMVDFLDIRGCRALTTWPASAQVRIGNVTARDCTALEKLPETLGPVSSLDLRNCARLKEIPEGVAVHSWIDIGGTAITSLPRHLRDTGLRWRGVAVTPRIAFEPHTLTVEEILGERNAEVRRVMIERVGLERFLSEAKAEVLHEDTDPGGPRQLLRIALPNDEDLVCVSVNCPSTGRHYLIRVPPKIATCHAAVAWTAGFDDPADYAPLVET